jgi:hypothetical protein
MGGGVFGVGEIGTVVGEFASLEICRTCFDGIDFGSSRFE